MKADNVNTKTSDDQPRRRTRGDYHRWALRRSEDGGVEIEVLRARGGGQWTGGPVEGGALTRIVLSAADLRRMAVELRGNGSSTSAGGWSVQRLGAFLVFSRQVRGAPVAVSVHKGLILPAREQPAAVAAAGARRRSCGSYHNYVRQYAEDDTLTILVAASRGSRERPDIQFTATEPPLATIVLRPALRDFLGRALRSKGSETSFDLNGWTARRNGPNIVFSGDVADFGRVEVSLNRDTVVRF